MKILTFTSLFPNHLQPDHAVFIKNRITALSKFKKADIKIVAPVPYFPPLKINKRWFRFSQINQFEVLNDLHIYHPRYIVTPKIGMSLYGLSMFFGVLPTVKKIYKDFPFDLIDAHYIYPDGFAAVLLGNYFRIPVVLSARGSDINVYPKFKLIRKIIKYSLASAASVISVSSSLKNIMIKDLNVPAEKIEVIPNGINREIFYKIDKNKAKKMLGLSSTKKIVISVGSLIEPKGHHLLIEAVSILKHKKLLDFQTYIIGSGEYAGVLEEKISQLGLKDNITLAGQVRNEELVYWYNAADLFFLGSSREGWPNVVSESLACGTPAVATKVNGIPEIISSEDYGIMVERNSTEFANGILKGLTKEWDSDKIYEYGQSRSWEAVASEVYTFFNYLKQ